MKKYIVFLMCLFALGCGDEVVLDNFDASDDYGDNLDNETLPSKRCDGPYEENCNYKDILEAKYYHEGCVTPCHFQKEWTNEQEGDFEITVLSWVKITYMPEPSGLRRDYGNDYKEHGYTGGLYDGVRVGLSYGYIIAQDGYCAFGDPECDEITIWQSYDPKREDGMYILNGKGNSANLHQGWNLITKTIKNSKSMIYIGDKLFIEEQVTIPALYSDVSYGIFDSSEQSLAFEYKDIAIIEKSLDVGDIRKLLESSY